MQNSDKIMLEEMYGILRPSGESLRAISSELPPIEGNRKQRRIEQSKRRKNNKKLR